MSITRGGLDATLGFLAEIEKYSLAGSGGVALDLSNCTFISRAACLLLTAQIDRCLARHAKSISGKNPLSRDVCQRLHDFGFYTHLKFRSPANDDDDQSNIKVCSGVGVSEDLSRRLEEVASVARLVFPDEAVVESVHGALNEAVTNIVGHAYSEEVRPTHIQSPTNFHMRQVLVPGFPLPALPKPVWHGRWWFAGYANVQRGELLLYALDHGQSIPAIAPLTMSQTLVDYWRKQNPTTRVKPDERTEAEILDGVARARRMGVGTGRRGQGFPTMIRLVENSTSQGQVRVISGRGFYEFDKPLPLSTPKERSFELINALSGTLIEWRLCLPRPKSRQA